MRAVKPFGALFVRASVAIISRIAPVASSTYRWAGETSGKTSVVSAYVLSSVPRRLQRPLLRLSA